jgi:hypothetical protein
MGTETHWESVYGTKSPEAVSWYAPHLLQSLHYVRRAARSKQASIIDVGGGESTLVDDLLADGYQDITVLDLSRTALEVTQLLRISEFLDTKFGTVDTLFGTEVSQLHQSPCGKLPAAHRLLITH